MEDLANTWNRLSLSDREQKGYVLRSDHRTGEYLLAAKFLTPHFLIMNAVAKTFKQFWRSTNGFKIRHLGDHKVLFIFDNLPDVDRIILHQPWSFDKYLVVVQRYDSDTPARELLFNRATFWVQVHNIPLRFMTKEMAECLCETVGEVSKSTGAVDDEGGHFMRVRVTIDLSLPLCRGRVITLMDGGKSWVAFKYERLPNFCYWCGRLTHDDKNCELWIHSKGSLKVENQQFNSSLRVAPYTTAGKDVIFVPGYYEDRIKRVNQSPVVPVVSPAEVVVEESPAMVSQPGLETENSGGEINAESFSNSNSRKGKEKITGEDFTQVSPKISESTVQINLESPSFPVPSKCNDLFSAVLHDIDKELSKFDSSNSELGGNSISAVSKCPLSPDLPSFKEFATKSPTSQSRDSLIPHVPPVLMSTSLTDVPISILSEVPALKKGTWKRLVQADPRVDTNWEKSTQSKRSLNSLDIPNELPCKRRLVSHQEEVHCDILAEVAQQPCQRQ